ncbi:hypothetical protein A2833_01275 [Candidatus Azambacteria bacterium RIFCSPHIGHO2_01_FULL_44_55]|uniref:Uncharacterized protein n=1 Tax=Candidatus Azambacteria bacterium RIFCSPLOWO2_02_FULL_44_14 TaxID=1797306 RepID=A0A1F5C9Q6_9BACT|nr:MAG: hypothetical protein A3A18_01845 [Candidatus Azambacteria bacterium RIFCSPLOWO2_01_FULL_44_84]OGD33155.1 MAG: hypothetical protein A3C78_02745 [Candidatus Azambacteria bacterium RIFCSPHIGHO2_02_FULL_45_18]OGD39600.1 MAG: hypothetical protein A3I30_03815 [Candidatus Azambacteria bacterium RIFCSPLOWO2_02_FULL_44_14]OGD39926.1 MAG: hypothetical protein A2833_01275 [Candidatus Azambacteria bacterium RIFCSPHIGHO2_01_FULL_44_55]OGD52468.1 MAG: hypothetical protein A2608_00110 [Candidatus Azam
MQTVGEVEKRSQFVLGEEVEVFVRSYVSVFVDLGCGKWFRGCVDEIKSCGEDENKTFFITVYVDELSYGRHVGVYEGQHIRKING